MIIGIMGRLLIRQALLPAVPQSLALDPRASEGPGIVRSCISFHLCNISSRWILPTFVFQYSLTIAVLQGHRDLSTKIKVGSSNFKVNFRTWDGGAIHICSGGNSPVEGVSHILKNSELVQGNGSSPLKILL